MKLDPSVLKKKIFYLNYDIYLLHESHSKSYAVSIDINQNNEYRHLILLRKVQYIKWPKILAEQVRCITLQLNYTIYHLFIPKHNISIIQMIIMSGTRAINNPTRYLQLLIILVSD